MTDVINAIKSEFHGEEPTEYKGEAVVNPKCIMIGVACIKDEIQILQNPCKTNAKEEEEGFRELIIGGGPVVNNLNTHFDITMKKDISVKFISFVKNLYFRPRCFVTRKGNFAKDFSGVKLDKQGLQEFSFDIKFREEPIEYVFDIEMLLVNKQQSAGKFFITPIIIDPKIKNGGGDGL